MKGLWHVPTTAIHPGISAFVVDFFAFVIITCFTTFGIVRRSKHWSEATILHAGLVCLSMYSFFHWTDTTHRQFGNSTTYGYLFANTFYQIFRVFSEILVLWGCSRVLVRYQHLRNDEGILSTHEDRPYWLGVIVLWFLGIYQLCLLFVLSSAWLSFADLKVINELAKAQNACNIAYTATQLCYSIYMIRWNRNLPCNGANSLANAQDMLRQEWFYIEQKKWAYPAACMLGARSFSETFILGFLDGWARNLTTIYLVRDISYGVFSTIFVVFVTFAVPTQKGFIDPLVKEKDDKYQAEKTAKQAARQRVRDWINPKIEEMTEFGKKTAPTMDVLLTLLESEIGGWVPMNDPYDTLEEMRLEIAGLREVHKDWEPIFKFDHGKWLEKQQGPV